MTKAKITQTGPDSAVVGPIVLRPGERTRMVFRPQIVNNKQEVGTVQLREQKLQKTGVDFNIIYQADMMVASYLVGHGILRTECAIELSKAGTAGAGETIKAKESV